MSRSPASGGRRDVSPIPTIRGRGIRVQLRESRRRRLRRPPAGLRAGSSGVGRGARWPRRGLARRRSRGRHGAVSRRFALLCVQLVAVEPARNMRAVIEDRLAAVRPLDGSAEAIPLGDGVADAVVVGNAFHHVDAERAFDEIRRVLRPGAVLALFWAWPADDQTGRYPGVQHGDEAVGAVRAATAIADAYRIWARPPIQEASAIDRKSTRLN